MAQMRLGHLQHGLSKRGLGQPLRHLVPQDAMTLGNWAVICGPPPLSGDDKHKPQSLSLRAEHKSDQLRMRFGKRQAVQVDAGFW